jgi:hypothetical protein
MISNVERILSRFDSVAALICAARIPTPPCACIQEQITNLSVELKSKMNSSSETFNPNTDHCTCENSQITLALVCSGS